MPPTPTWNPHDVCYVHQEANMLDHKGHLIDNRDHCDMDIDNPASIFSHKVNSVLLPLSPAIEPWSLATALTTLQDHRVSTMALGELQSLISPEELART